MHSKGPTVRAGPVGIAGPAGCGADDEEGARTQTDGACSAAADKVDAQAQTATAVPEQDDAAGSDEASDEVWADAAKGLGPPVDDRVLAAWVGRIVYQDQAALACLYRSLSGGVFAQAMRITRDVGCAQEVVEDVFWQVWRQAPRFDPERGTALAWVRRIARSRALDALRALGRNPLRRAVDLDQDQLPDAGGSRDEPSCRIAEAQSTALVEKALATLDPLRRQLVSLAFQRGYSQTEIAHKTGLPLGTVKSHIRRALLSMKHSIQAAERPQLAPQAPR